MYSINSFSMDELTFSFSTYIMPLFSYIQNSKTLQDSPSHRIFERIHEVLNVAK